MPSYYPVFLNLTGKRCVIFGGGSIAEGKISKLKETGAQVTIISPEATPAIQKLAQTGVVEWNVREYRAGDLEAEPLEQLDGRRHSAGVELGVETQRAQPGLLQQRGGGQAVVPGTHDDGVEVRHRLRLTRPRMFCQY